MPLIRKKPPRLPTKLGSREWARPRLASARTSGRGQTSCARIDAGRDGRARGARGNAAGRDARCTGKVVGCVGGLAGRRRGPSCARQRGTGARSPRGRGASTRRGSGTERGRAIGHGLCEGDSEDLASFSGGCAERSNPVGCTSGHRWRVRCDCHGQGTSGASGASAVGGGWRRWVRADRNAPETP